ncbi:MAG: hypothetical protein GDA48_05205 [Hormoscilla sp. GM102CHS1]|nr:hypothetical protein [Hormoscilla sp. GM102CHS1]
MLFFNALLTHLHISDVQVEQYGGKDALGSYLKTLKVRSGYREVVSLGIARDADNSAHSAFQSVCGALNRAGLAVPSKSGEITLNSPQVIVMILPDNENPGMLEDLCLAAVSADPVLQCIDEYFKCVNNIAERQQPKNMVVLTGGSGKTSGRSSKGWLFTLG